MACGAAPTTGNLTIDGFLTIGGNLAFEINKSQTPANDTVTATGNLQSTGDGALTVSNNGPALAVGDRFYFLNQAVANGGALSIGRAGAQWVNNLAVDGSMAASSVVPSVPTNMTFGVSNGVLLLSWPSGYLGWIL